MLLKQEQNFQTKLTEQEDRINESEQERINREKLLKEEFEEKINEEICSYC